MIQAVLFVIASIGLVAISWRSLRQPTSHGFYRFFAWEMILALFALNVENWFYRPFAWNQLIAWSLLILSLIPLAFGVVSLRTSGRPVERRDGDPSLLAFEKTTMLVTSGIYQYIRHPMYSSLLLFAWGIFFKSPSWVGGVLSSVATIFLLLTARADEAECVRFFGSEYVQYMKHTKRFLPFVF